MMFGMNAKTISTGTNIWPEMVVLIVDQMELETETVYAISYMIYLDEDLSESRTIEISTVLCNRDRLLAIDEGTRYAIDMFSVKKLYPEAIYRILDAEDQTIIENQIDIKNIILNVTNQQRTGA